MKNEKFIRNWTKYRHKGKEKYVLTNGVVGAITMLIIFPIITLAMGKEYYLDTHLGLCLGSFIGGIIGALINWPRNEEKYNRLINNDSDK